MVLTEDQRTLQETARRFARKRLLPDYLRREREGLLDRMLLQEMGSLGLLGTSLPQEHGGLAADGVTTGLIVEELAYGDFNIVSAVLACALIGSILMRHARPAVRQEWLPRLVAGEAVAAICVTEPRGGSDAASLQLRARREGEHYILNGEKTSITFAEGADAFLVFARTGRPEDGAKGVSAFWVPRSLPGVSSTRFDDVGGIIVGRGSLFLDEVRCPASHLVGEEGQGFAIGMHGFDYNRILIGLQCCGAAQASLDEAWAYAAERQAFGRPIAQFQGVTFPLAEGESRIAGVRQLCHHALSLRDAGLRHTAEAAMCKWMAAAASFDIIHQCLLTLGHYGYSKETAHQQRMRDVMGLEIGDGTASVLKQVIARERIGRAAVQYGG